ncbi:MAG TPA: hypothetical protein VF342_04305 [Alphaproteobacteria bacterium]
MARKTWWDWSNVNCWAGVIGCVAATTARLLLGSDVETPALLPSWLPPDFDAVFASVLGGASGFLGALLVDWIRPPQ